ncbi:MAG TPA: PIN domain-containing protein [Burkholderiales bacterium]
MTGRVFVDANVFVYAHDPADRVKQARAAGWIAHLWRESLGRTSMQVLSECYVTFTRKLAVRIPAERAWEEMSALLAWRPQPIDEPLLRRSWEIEQRYRLSWWDSMVVAAGQLQECSTLLTEDLQDGMTFGPLTVRSPFTLQIGEPSSLYAIPAVYPRHRPRGRPRRTTAAASR